MEITYKINNIEKKLIKINEKINTNTNTNTNIIISTLEDYKKK